MGVVGGSTVRAFGEGLWIETYSWEAKVTLFITTSRGSWLPGSQSNLWRPLSPPGMVVILQAHSSPEDNCFWYGKNNLVKRTGACYVFLSLSLFLSLFTKERMGGKKERVLWKVLIHQKTRVKREQYAPFWLFSSLPLFFSFFPGVWRCEETSFDQLWQSLGHVKRVARKTLPIHARQKCS